MKLVDKPDMPLAAGHEMTRWESFVSRLKRQWWFLRRKLPHLVWYGDELDVRITFMADKLDPADPFGSLYNGALSDARRCLNEAGIAFDTGIGLDGRDWEWDWSLKGPISVRFVSRATKPERRRERPKPTLVKPCS